MLKPEPLETLIPKPWPATFQLPGHMLEGDMTLLPWQCGSLRLARWLRASRLRTGTLLLAHFEARRAPAAASLLVVVQTVKIQLLASRLGSDLRPN
jgi:hypothetical protein